MGAEDGLQCTGIGKEMSNRRFDFVRYLLGAFRVKTCKIVTPSLTGSRLAVEEIKSGWFTGGYRQVDAPE